jgi:tight adherence protein B
MVGLLTAPELWIGLGLFMAVAYWQLAQNDAAKKFKTRLARVTNTQPMVMAKAAATSSLRRSGPDKTAIGQFLQNFSSIDKLQARLTIAGISARPQKFLGIMLGLGIAATLFMLMVSSSLALAPLIGILLGVGGPHMYVGRKIKQRKMTFLKSLPDAIDLIVRGLRAGLPVGEAFQNIAKEIPPPVGDTFGTISQQIALGLTMEKALSDMAERLDITEFNFFVTTIILQRETGGNLSEILGNLSEVLRQRGMFKLKIGALSSEARASAIIVGALPFVVWALLSIISPSYLRPLYDDYRGNLALLGAGCSILFGALIMKRMTQLEI